MKKLLFVSGLLIAASVYGFFSCSQKKVIPEKEIAKAVVTQVDSFVNCCKMLQVEAEKKNGG